MPARSLTTSPSMSLSPTHIFLALALGSSLLLPSCLTFYSGKGPHAKEQQLEQRAQQHGAVTFSVFRNNSFVNTPNKAWVSEEQIVTSIQDKLVESGLFSDVRHVELEQAGPRHLHFDVNLYGSMEPTTAFLSCLTCTAFPTAMVLNMNTTMTLFSHGRPRTRRQTQHTNTDIIWLPFAIVTPFYYNHRTGRNQMLEGTMNYFLQELRQTKFE